MAQGVAITEEDRGYDLVMTVLAKNLVLTADTGTYSKGEIVELDATTNKGIKYTDGTYVAGNKLLVITDDLNSGDGADTTGTDKTVTALSIGIYRESAVTPTLTATTRARLANAGIELQ